MCSSTETDEPSWVQIALSWVMNNNGMNNTELAILSNVSVEWRNVVLSEMKYTLQSLVYEDHVSNLKNLLLPDMGFEIVKRRLAEKNITNQIVRNDSDSFCLAWFHPRGIKIRTLDVAEDVDESSSSDDDNGVMNLKSHLRNATSRLKNRKIKASSEFKTVADEWQGYRNAMDILIPFGYAAVFVREYLGFAADFDLSSNCIQNAWNEHPLDLEEVSPIKDIMGTCHRFTLASEFGVTDGHINDTEIAVVYPKIGVKGAFLSPFVNIDATTIPGINRAISMGFPASNHLADVVVSPYLYEANDLFTPTSKGRLLSVFRHPNERSLSLFYYLQYAEWEPTYDPTLKDWTVAQYAMSEKFENNWLTRQLTNELEGELTDAHLQMAIEVLRRKFLVGLMPRMEETMTRFERYFRWKYIVSPATQETCREDLLKGKVNSNTKNKHDKPKEGSEEWNLLSEQNNIDLQLYAYVESLFDEQEAFVADIPVNIRLDQSTCCMCEPATFSPDGRECPITIQEL